MYVASHGISVTLTYFDICCTKLHQPLILHISPIFVLQAIGLGTPAQVLADDVIVEVNGPGHRSLTKKLRLGSWETETETINFHSSLA